jgi:SAM-dependent methyltransferase
MTIPYIHIDEIHDQSNARKLCDYISRLLEPKSVIDVGCGTGNFLAIFKQLGVKRVLGLDGNWVDRSQQQKHLQASEFLAVDLNQPLKLKEHFDLAICLEVAEHLNSSSSTHLVNFLTDISDTIIFSAAIPFQPGQNHINLNWPENWATRFRDNGMLISDDIRRNIWEDEEIPWWYRQNVFIAYRENTCASLKLRHTDHLSPLVHPRHLEMYAKWNEELLKDNHTTRNGYLPLRTYLKMIAKRYRMLFRDLLIKTQ